MYIKIIFPILVAMTVVACSGSQSTNETAATTSSYEMPHIKRPNLVVADLERSLVIYRDILGLDASDISTSAPTSFSYPVFKIPAGAQIRSATLHSPTEQRVLALTEVEQDVLPVPPNGPHMSAIVIGVSNLEETFNKIEALGLEITETRIAGGAEFEFIEQAFVDYDGHLIVCYQILP